MGKKFKKRFLGGKKMTKKKKILIGAGVAAVAVAGIAGTLFVGKVLYDRRKKGKALGSGHGTREIVDDGPESPALAPFRQPFPKTFTDTVMIPDAVALGLSYDDDSQAKINLLAACFDAAGQNLGYVQAGGSLSTLFNGAVQHTGDAQAASLGDHENIVIDLRNLPGHVSTILFGTYLVNPPTQGPAKAYVHMLPMMRNEQIQAQEASGGTRSIDYDSDEDFQEGSRGIGDEEEEEEDFVRLYMDDLDAIGAPFFQQRGLVGGKIFRDQTGVWRFTPYRLVVAADPQFGLWPALEHYAKPAPAQQQPAQGYYQQQPAYGAPAPYY
jgi:hypothetical protein